MKMSRTGIVELINNSKGKIFTVTFTKRNGEERVMNCNRCAGAPTNLGYIKVNDLRKKSIRNVDPRTITSISINGKVYKAK